MAHSLWWWISWNWHVYWILQNILTFIQYYTSAKNNFSWRRWQKWPHISVFCKYLQKHVRWVKLTISKLSRKGHQFGRECCTLITSYVYVIYFIYKAKFIASYLRCCYPYLTLHSKLQGMLYTLQLCNNWHLSAVFLTLDSLSAMCYLNQGIANWPNCCTGIKWSYLYHFLLYVFIGCTC